MNFLYKLLLQPFSEVNLVIFRKSGESYDYVSILPHPPSHLVSKRKHLALPTHPPFWLRNIWMVPYHSDLECLITFGNWFWDLIVGNRSKVLNFYQQRPVFALKNYPRPQRPKRPMKANKGQQSPKLQISLLLSLFNVKSSINVNMILKKVFLKNLKFSFSLHKLLEITFCWIC